MPKIYSVRPRKKRNWLYLRRLEIQEGGGGWMSVYIRPTICEYCSEGGGGGQMVQSGKTFWSLGERESKSNGQIIFSDWRREGQVHQVQSSLLLVVVVVVECILRFSRVAGEKTLSLSLSHSFCAVYIYRILFLFIPQSPHDGFFVYIESRDPERYISKMSPYIYSSFLSISSYFFSFLFWWLKQKFFFLLYSTFKYNNF